MSADEEFGREVGERLREEVSDLYADRDLATALRRRAARRTWTIRTAIGAPLVAAAAAVAALAPSGTTTQPSQETGQAAPPAATTTTTTQPRIENVAQVRDLTIQALRSAKDYVIHEVNNLDHGYHEFWTDRSTDRYRMDAYSSILPMTGMPAPSSGVRLPPIDGPATGPMRKTHSIAGDGPLGDRHYVNVDYDRKTWSRFHDTEAPTSPEVPDILDADALRKAIDEGRMELIGPEKIGDRDTHHLRLFATFRGYRIDLWVDSATYLPVRETSAVIDDPDTPVMTSDYDWLPRTEENLAKLTLTPPPDFTQKGQ